MDSSIEVDEVKVEETAPAELTSPNNDSKAKTNEKMPVPEKDSNHNDLQNSQKALVSSTRKHGGPRTEMGKERSRLNALKHGIFSKVVLVRGESHSQFNVMLRGLRDDFQPVGTLEDILVEKLATILFRYRRFLQAESGDVIDNFREVEYEKARTADRALERKYEIGVEMGKSFTTGLIHQIDRPGVLEECLEWLRMAKGCFEEDGFGKEVVWAYLGAVYGAREKDDVRKDHFRYCLACFTAYRASEEQRRKWGFASTEDCIDKCIDATEKEIQRLEALPRCPIPKRRPTADQLEYRRKESYQCAIPRADKLDRLLRYEASLERSLDRILSQLERVQRTRRGQPVPPAITVNLS